MTHFEFQPEQLSALLDGQLAPEQRAAVERHLAAHPHDAQLYEDLQRLRTQMRALPTLKAPRALRENVMRGIEAQQPAPMAVAYQARSSINATHWLFAAAASLGTLALVTVYHSVLRDAPLMVAQSDQSSSGFPNEMAKGQSSMPEAVTRDAPAVIGKLSMDPVPFVAGSGEAARPEGGVASVEQLAVDNVAPPALDADMLPPAAAESVPLAAKESTNQPAGFGGGGDQGQKSLAAQTPESQNRVRETPELSSIFDEGLKQELQPGMELADEGADPAVRPDGSVVADERGTRLDHLVFVRVPAGQSVESWIEDVFHRSQVQLEKSEDVDSYGKLVERRAEQIQAQDLALDRNQAAGQKDALLPDVAPATEQPARPQLLPAQEYLAPNEYTTAYWVDAEIQQIRGILEQLDGAVIVGFVAPGFVEPSDKARMARESYHANAPIARRLGRLPDPLASEGERQRPVDELAQNETVPIKPGLAALGLEGKSPTARYRILFVFYAGQVSSAPETAAPSPANK